jgi:hypothetical protein
MAVREPPRAVQRGARYEIGFLKTAGSHFEFNRYERET